MLDITAFGEVLIDFTPAGISETGMRLFEQNPGGAPANVAVALQKLGGKAAFIGKVGHDMHGEFLINTLRDNGVDVSGIRRDENTFTTLAFVALDDEGERTFSFSRKPGADTQLTIDEIDNEKLTQCQVFHFGSLSLTNEPSRSATLYAVSSAKENGAIISYDPNYRPLLWESEEVARQTMRSVIPLVDIIKLSDEETQIITGASDPIEASELLLKQGVYCVVVTLGAAGALVRVSQGDGGYCLVQGIDSNAVDTTGAGDAFWGGFLYQMTKNKVVPKFMSLEKAINFTRFGNAVASLCIQKRGAIPAMPSYEMVMECLK